MKSLLACVFAIAPTTVLAQVSTDTGLTADALTRALNTSPPQQAAQTRQDPENKPPVVTTSGQAALGSSNAAPIAQPRETPQSDPGLDVEAVTRALNTSPPRQAVKTTQAPVEGASSAPSALQPSGTGPTVDIETLIRALNEGKPSPARQGSTQQAQSPSGAAPIGPARREAEAVVQPQVRGTASEEPRQAAQPQAAAPQRQARDKAPDPLPPQAEPPLSEAPLARSRPASEVTTTVAAPAASPAQATVPASAAQPVVPRRETQVPGVLNAAAIHDLPFEMDIPQGVQLVAVSTARDAKVWAVRKGPVTLAMIFAGSQSQFPIFEGEQVTVAGRTSVVLDEGVRRVAVEHLFQREQAPQELHIWLMVSQGADRDLAERIAQTLDYR